MKKTTPVKNLYPAALLCLLFVASLGASTTLGQNPTKDIVVPKIAGGTRVGLKPDQPWTNIVLVSSSRVSRGDTEQISEAVANYASMLHFVILARVDQPNSGMIAPNNAPYQLSEIAVGLAVQQNGHLVIVSGTPAPGASIPQFGFLESQVVRQSTKSLDEMKFVARQTTLAIFDSPAIVLQGGRNVSLIIRTLTWIDPTSGRLGSAVWFLQPSSTGYKVVDNRAAYLADNFREDRELHVDAGHFTFGVPGPKAFGLVQLPAGVPIPMSSDLATVAGQENYTQADIARLANLLSTALQAL